MSVTMPQTLPFQSNVVDGKCLSKLNKLIKSTKGLFCVWSLAFNEICTCRCCCVIIIKVLQNTNNIKIIMKFTYPAFSWCKAIYSCPSSPWDKCVETSGYKTSCSCLWKKICTKTNFSSQILIWFISRIYTGNALMMLNGGIFSTFLNI